MEFTSNMPAGILENPKNEALQLHHPHGLLHMTEELDGSCIVLLVQAIRDHTNNSVHS